MRLLSSTLLPWQPDIASHQVSFSPQHHFSSSRGRSQVLPGHLEHAVPQRVLQFGLLFKEDTGVHSQQMHRPACTQRAGSERRLLLFVAPHKKTNVITGKPKWHCHRDSPDLGCTFASAIPRSARTEVTSVRLLMSRKVSSPLILALQY